MIIAISVIKPTTDLTLIVTISISSYFFFYYILIDFTICAFIYIHFILSDIVKYSFNVNRLSSFKVGVTKGRVGGPDSPPRGGGSRFTPSPCAFDRSNTSIYTVSI